MALSIEGLIGSLGFPIAVTVWLLYRDSKKEDDFSKCLFEIKTVVVNNTTVLEKIEKVIAEKNK